MLYWSMTWHMGDPVYDAADLKRQQDFAWKERARATMARAVRTGALRRKVACDRCGGLPAEGHHPDYDEPLVVLWHCRACHNATHNRLRRFRRQ